MTAPAAVLNEVAHGPMDLVRMAIEFNLHPERDFHRSWLPLEWPAAYRRIERFGPAGRQLLGKYLRRWGVLDQYVDFNFDSRRRRLALMDGKSLRLLAAYCGLCAHRRLFEGRSTGPQMHRFAQRLDPDAADFVLYRAPQLPGLVLNDRPARKNPIGVGSLVMDRGYRILIGMLATEGDALLGRTLRKLPRRVSTMKVPPFKAAQLDQIGELMFLCLIPERLPQWDWLF
jgi:type III secretion protein K